MGDGMCCFVAQPRGRRCLSQLLLALFLAFSGSAGSAQVGDGAVVELTVRSFADAVVESGIPWLISFYMPGSAECERLSETWPSLGLRLAGKVQLGQIDAMAWEGVADAWNISAYPTLKLFVRGMVYDYEGALNSEAIASFALGGFNSTTASEEVALGELDSTLRGVVAETWFLKFYAPWCGHCKRLAPTWEELARRLLGRIHVAKVDATVDAEFAEAWGVSGFPTLILVAGGQAFDYAGDRDLASLQAFAEGGYRYAAIGRALPTMRPSFAQKLTTKDFFRKFPNRQGTTWFVNFYMPSCGACKALAPTWEAVAERLQGHVYVAKVDVSEEREFAEAMGIARFPTMKLYVGRNVYEYEGQRAAEKLAEFALQGFLSKEPQMVLPDSEDAGMIGQPLGWAPLVVAFGLGGAMAFLAVVGRPLLPSCPKKAPRPATVAEGDGSRLAN